jgi:hypothetical protein
MNIHTDVTVCTIRVPNTGVFLFVENYRYMLMRRIGVHPYVFYTRRIRVQLM